MIEQIILVFHVVVAIFIVVFILLQQGKGSDMGASFGGGSSQTVFGAQGSGNLLTKWTAILVFLFLLTSLSMAYFAHTKSEQIYDVIIDQNAVQATFQIAPVEGEVAAPDVPEGVTPSNTDNQSDVPVQ